MTGPFIDMYTQTHIHTRFVLAHLSRGSRRIQALAIKETGFKRIQDSTHKNSFALVNGDDENLIVIVLIIFPLLYNLLFKKFYLSPSWYGSVD